MYVKLAYSNKVKILLSTKAEKQLKKVPNHIRTKFDYWCDLINEIGPRKSRLYKEL